MDKYEKLKNRRLSKYKSTLQYALKEIQEHSKSIITPKDGRSFRCSFSHDIRDNSGESKEHSYSKFNRWYLNRSLGRLVFTELTLKDNSRPDLIIACRDGSVFVEEIAVTEGQESFTRKFIKYPWPVKIIRMEV